MNCFVNLISNKLGKVREKIKKEKHVAKAVEFHLAKTPQLFVSVIYFMDTGH